jgi:hypothetical protein
VILFIKPNSEKLSKKSESKHRQRSRSWHRSKQEWMSVDGAALIARHHNTTARSTQHAALTARHHNTTARTYNALL